MVQEFTVEAGPLYYVCFSGESEETSKLVGKGGPLEVSPKRRIVLLEKEVSFLG